MGLNPTNRLAQITAAGFGTGAFTSTAFTPSNSSLLCVAIGMQDTTDQIAALAAMKIDAIDAIGNSLRLTFTNRTDLADNALGAARIYTAPITNGVNTRIVLNFGGRNVYQINCHVVDYTGYDPALPIGATASVAVMGTSGEQSITLSSAPAINSQIWGARLASGLTAGDLCNATQGLNYIETGDTADTGNTGFQTQARPPGSTSTSFDWVNVSTPGAAGAIGGLAIEVREDPNASTVFTRPVKIAGATGALNSLQSSSQLVRTSTGNLYAAIITSGDVRVYKSTNNGISWTLVDVPNAPFTARTAVASAIDSNDVMHIAWTTGGATIGYVSFATSTDTYGRVEKFPMVSTNTAVAIAVDSNNIPHVVTTSNNWRYTNRLGGVWKTNVTITAAGTSSSPDIQIDQNNVPQVINYDNAIGITVAIGNKNNATSFTFNTIAGLTASTVGGASLAIDISGNTYAAYQGANSGLIQLAKHIKTDAWSTWQTAVTNGFTGKSVSLAADANDIYIFYERNQGGIAYDRYDTVNGKWLGEQIIQPVSSRPTTNIRPHNPFVKWSQYFNNGDTGANNTAQEIIEYLFDDGTTVYYDRLITAQVSVGYVSIDFSPPQAAGGTTTSTSSTSSSTSTSISTSSTSTSVSTSISTSSTSQSTSISTSTSSTSTSRSTSTSSTSSSTSKSTSTSSTSQSTSTSISTSSTSSSTSISTSSTSSSISTSSTSSSISTSSTSQSTSVSTSISTSSTSQSTSLSISTSSTSSSISTSSTSSSTSTSLSTSTSSTSQSTSLSTSISTSSTSTSLSTSSTSQSTSVSTSLSTSSTSSSTSVSFTTSTSSTSSSISTSSTSSSTSTSRSTSTSSTSASTSISTSTTSSSTSQSTSISTSSTSSSTSTTVSFTTSTSSTSSSISTSSTSSSTSKSTSTSSTSSSISTSSTSTSKSTSTSSTSQSTSLSTSISSTSASTSKSTSTSSTSTSLSTSTSSTSQSTSKSTSTSSTSLSTSTSVSFTTSTSSTSNSTSRSTSTSSTSTSISTSSTSASTSTTLIDVNMIPRATIRPFNIWTKMPRTRTP